MHDSRPSRSKPRWYQYGLRSLVVLTVVVSVGLGWLGSRLQRVAGELGSNFPLSMHVWATGLAVRHSGDPSSTRCEVDHFKSPPPGLVEALYRRRWIVLKALVESGLKTVSANERFAGRPATCGVVSDRRAHL
jgi:hypothetical protein